MILLYTYMIFKCLSCDYFMPISLVFVLILALGIICTYSYYRENHLHIAKVASYPDMDSCWGGGG